MQQYQLEQSLILNRFNITLYGLLLLAISFFLHEMIVISALLGALTLLLLFRDQARYRFLKSQDPAFIITLRESTASIELDRLGQHLEFENFRLFTNRWFLILQMRNQQTSENLVILSDRFKTMTEYLRFRYQLINMTRNQHLA